MSDRARNRAVRELADHLEDLYEEALARGATEDEARQYVESKLGETADTATDVLTAVRESLGARLGRWAEEREDKLQGSHPFFAGAADRLRDLRLAARSLFRCPLFTGIVIFVLALGIGATTAIFTLVDAIVISPLPFRESHRLMVVGHTTSDQDLQDAGQCAAWHLTYEDEAEVFDDLGMWTAGSVTATGGGAPEMVSAMAATSGVFRALSLNPIVGRALTPNDDDPESPNALLLGHGFWQSRYGGDTQALQQTIEINGEPWTIVGVMSPAIRGLDLDPEVILPFRIDREGLFVGNIGYASVARLRDGISVDQAVADMSRVLPMAWEKFPGGPVASSSGPDDYTPFLRPLKDNLVGSAANLLWFLLAGVGVVLLISFANVANLFLVRAEAKETEMAVRTAIGANRGRVAWEYLKESLLLGTLGGVAGLVLSFVCLRVVVAADLASLPRLADVSISPRVLIFVLAISLGGGILIGVVPVLKRSRAGLVDTLKQGGQSGMRSRQRRRIQNSLAVAQMALTLVLLVAAGLMLRSVWALNTVDPGFGHPHELLSFRIGISQALIEDREETARVHEAIARRLARVPGVEAVGMATGIPMGGGSNVNPFYARDSAKPQEGPVQMRRHKWVGEDYFKTMGIPLLAGRTLTWADAEQRQPVAMVSEGLAREYWGSPAAAVGQRVAVRPEPVRWHEIVGVVADVRENGLGQDPVAMVYWPQVTLAFWEGTTEEDIQTWRTQGFMIRSPLVGQPGFLRTVQEAVWEINPDLPLRSVNTMNDLMANSITRTSSTFFLISLAGIVALILGIVGVYGVIAYGVARRSREIGMRIALGAQQETVMKMVLRQGFMLASIGIAAGIVLAVALTRLMAALLYEVSPMDPVTFVVVAVGLLAVALLASWIPARRAAGVTPMEALRVE